MLKKILSLFLAGLILSLNGVVFGDEVYKGTVTKSGVNEDLRKEAAAEYSSQESEIEVNFNPMFKDWDSKKAQTLIYTTGERLLISNNIEDFARFEVSKKLVVNATTNYHGTITLYSGLLRYVENEDELAYVMGHELGHVTADDVKKGIMRRAALIGATAVGTALVGAYSNKKTAAATGASMAGVATLADLKFSRGQEARADRAAIDYMTKAGYNPLAAISMQNKIMARRWDFVSTHPGGDKRMFMAYKYIQLKYPKYIPVGFNTSAYNRGMVVVNKMLTEEQEKQQQKED